MSSPSTDAPPAERRRDLLARLDGLMLSDERRLRRRIEGLNRRTKGRGPSLDDLTRQVEAAERRLADRNAVEPHLAYPEQLPVSQRRDDLLDAIRDNQVVVVAGETGSGKTTQLPKICLELGRGRRGMIGHTQPRRIAARAVAERLAEELQTTVGDTVGFAVRFTDRVSDSSLVKLMTDGILLAEIQRDRMLLAYDTIIIDEAHERSLNIDFLLGYLQQLLPRRPDLKVVITSATIDPQRFSRYFADAPIVEVSGRGYPVDIWYRPVVDVDDPAADQDRDQVTAVCDAVVELGSQAAGDVLVFLSGEREIRDTADALTGMRLPRTEILPLYSRLAAAEQHRIFAQHSERRIVLATNVAETSLTVPGIKYVIDAGTARISRYSNRTKVQLLPIEPISQASARQRAGRCGRTSNGICIRLYSEADFDSRPAFTDPEILRTNLASVILQMASLELGSVEDFGFLDPPDRRQVADGIALLGELGALTTAAGDTPRLTDTGRTLSRLPVDPRLGRMIVEADRRGCVADVLILAAGLSIADVRERPSEHQQAADERHRRFLDPTSDFATLLNLWRYVKRQQNALSSNQFRRMCRTEFLNYLRIREWQDLVGQLRQIAKGMQITVGRPLAEAGTGDTDSPAVESSATVDAASVDAEQIHRSMLAGLLSHIGSKDSAKNDYLGARGARFAIFPGSATYRKQPEFLMAAELVETSRLFARMTAAIEPEWAEDLAGDLVKRTYSEPHWERRRGSVVAVERATLYGVPLIVNRKVQYGQIDPDLSRELFIRHALVERDWDSRHHFLRDNAHLIDEVRELESRARRRDLMVDDDTLFAFYDKRIPSSVVSARHFDSWWKKTRHRTPDLLTLTESDLLREDASALGESAFPDRWSVGDVDFSLQYRFAPGASDDGVTVTVPLTALPAAAGSGATWQVPGQRLELVTALLRTLPKAVRRGVVPIPDTASALLAAIPDDAVTSEADLVRSLAEQLASRGIAVRIDDFDVDRLPGHLRPTYRVVDEQGRTLGEGKDLGALQREFSATLRDTLQDATTDLTRDGITSWDIGTLPAQITRDVNGHRMTGYPALVDQGSTAGVRVLDTSRAADEATWAGTRRLLLLTIASPTRGIRNGLDRTERLAITQAPYPSPDAFIADCASAAVDEALRLQGGPVRSEAAFVELAQAVNSRAPELARQVFLDAVAALVELGPLRSAMTALTTPAQRVVADALRRQENDLVGPGFVGTAGARRLRNVRRYLQAMAVRAVEAPRDLARDAERQAQVDVVVRDLAELRAQVGDRVPSSDLDDIRWMIEELRVSLFAQKLGTAHPVSVPRIQAAMDKIEAAAH